MILRGFFAFGMENCYFLPHIFVDLTEVKFCFKPLRCVPSLFCVVTQGNKMNKANVCFLVLGGQN